MLRSEEEEERQGGELQRGWAEHIFRQPCHQLSRGSAGRIGHNDGSNNGNNNREENDIRGEYDSDDNKDDVQAEGWIGGEAEKEVESGVIADDHIYQSA